MNREEKMKQLREKIKVLEAQIEPLEKEWQRLYHLTEEEIKARVEKAERGKDKFTLDELLFSAEAKCECGAGLAYPEGISPWGAWYCSDILLGRAITKDKENAKTHTAALPFTFYEIKSEGQPSANGATTRPKDLLNP